jgi:Tfp pilus assembly protein PilW
LAEILIAVTISGFVLAAMMALYIQSLNTYYTDSNRVSLNHDMRQLVQYMAADAVGSTAFYLYTDFNTRTTSGEDDYLANGLRGQSGDFLVLVTTAHDPATGLNIVTKVVGYYRVPNATQPPASTMAIPASQNQATTILNLGTVYRFSVSGLSIPGATSITSILNTIMPTTMITSNVVFMPTTNNGSNGLSGVIGTASGTGRTTLPNNDYLFYNCSSGNDIVVNAQLWEQGSLDQTRVLARNTFNLTVFAR